MTFKGKNILITGASNGIGYALTKKIVANGGHVINLDLKHPEIPITNVQTIVTDIGNEESIEKSINKITGKIHIFINNAGIMRRGTLTESSSHDFDDIFRVNVKGAWLIFSKLQEKLNNKATILIVSSYHALEPTSDPALYAISKAAITKMAESISSTYSYTVKIAFLGPVYTALACYGISGKALEEKKKKMISPDKSGELLFKLITSSKKKLVFDSKKDTYSFA